MHEQAGERKSRTPTTTPGAAAAVVGGLLWVVYGVLEFRAPWGTDALYDEGRGYDVVLDRSLFTVYSAPGALALVLSALALLALLDREPGSRAARAGGLGAMVLGLLSGVGVAAGFDPLFTAPRIFGTLLLGLAVALAALAARRRGAPGEAALLAVVALLGVALLPLWPLVHALGWVTPTGGALLIAAHGAGWAAVGVRLLRADRQEVASVTGG